MHVPFSMSDEPDLGDEFKSYAIDNHEGNYEYVAEPNSKDGHLSRTYTQAEVDNLIAKMIRKLQETIDSYRKEIIEIEDELCTANEALYDVINWIECSQSLSALRAIVNRGLRQ